MTAAVLGLEVESGATFTHVLDWFNSDGVTPIDLTGCTARSDWRETVDSADVLLSLTTENNRLRITPELGRLTIHLTAKETEAITFESAVFDIEVVFPPDESGEIKVSRLAKGKVKVSKGVTRG